MKHIVLKIFRKASNNLRNYLNKKSDSFYKPEEWRWQVPGIV